jgi:hypothetical protein
MLRIDRVRCSVEVVPANSAVNLYTVQVFFSYSNLNIKIGVYTL